MRWVPRWPTRRRVPQRIGLLLPRATFDLFEGRSITSTSAGTGCSAGSKLAYTRIDEHLIREGKLQNMGLQVLILPDARALDDKVAGEIEQWVQRRGAADCFGRARRVG